ncbi:hypothetical protein [Arthrobacter sp. B10-11]|uniref:hypothetical protein n=1 Tax=Arthrobacter sp. B10-11 TaxID=3081160 RepID=UPI002952FA29|nr:hypothetical protein [Arthrobacter sp. B10-11]MDV8148542.1 hypothetical protein [Arthrobacter sp. B10-11]
MFTAKSERYAGNVKQAASLTARPAVQFTPEEVEQPAIVLRSSGQIHGVLPLAEALRLANELADLIAELREPKA